MRKLVFFSFCFYLIIGLATGAHAELEFYLDFGQDGRYENLWALDAGEEISADVYVSNVPEPGLVFMSFIMTCDSTKVLTLEQGTDVDENNWSLTRVILEKAGEVVMSGAKVDLSSGLSGDNIKLGTIRFRCVNPGESELFLLDRGTEFDCFVLADGTVLDGDIGNGVILGGIRAGYKGDLNGDGDVGLADAILSLQILARLQPSLSIRKQADVNGDRKIGLPDAIYILQKVSALR